MSERTLTLQRWTCSQETLKNEILAETKREKERKKADKGRLKLGDNKWPPLKG